MSRWPSGGPQSDVKGTELATNLKVAVSLTCAEMRSERRSAELAAIRDAQL